MIVRTFTTRLLLIIASLLVLVSLVACGQKAPPAAVTAVSIDQSDSGLVVGESLALSATVTAVGGAAEAVTWTSSDVAVATVSSAGVVEAVTVGATTITATSDFDPSKQDTVEITVSAVPAVAAVSIDQNDRTMAVGRSFTLSATVTAEGGAAEAVTWTSSDVAVATVSSAGVVEAVAVGDTTITATSSFDVTRTDSIDIAVLAPGSALWTQQFGSSDWDNASAVAVDSEGNVLIVGDTSGDLEGTSAGNLDAFVRKVDSNGTPVWTHQFGSSDEDSAFGVAVDSNGSVLIVGYTKGDLEGSGSSAGGSEAFVMKVDRNGSHVWTHQFGSGTLDYAYGVAVDSDDNVLVVGETWGDLDGSGSSAGGGDAFVMKVDSNGSPVWTHQFGTSDWDFAAGVAVDSDDNILMVGETRGALEGINAGGRDVFAMKVDSNGTPVWTHQFGTSNDDYAYGVAVDSDDNILIAGETWGDLEGSSTGSADAFVRKVSSGGVEDWTHQFGTGTSDYASGVAVDSDDNILIVGSTSGDLEGSSAGNRDVFARKVNSGGTEVWTRQFGSSASDYAFGVAVDSDDNVLIVGETEGDLEGSSAGNTDAFVRKHLP